MSSEIIIVPSLFFMIGFIVYVIVDGFRRRQQVKSRSPSFTASCSIGIGSAKEFGEFFSSEAGSRFLDSLSSSEAGAPQLTDPAVDAVRPRAARARHRLLPAHSMRGPSPSKRWTACW